MVTTCSICGTTEAVDPGEFIKSNQRETGYYGRKRMLLSLCFLD